MYQSRQYSDDLSFIFLCLKTYRVFLYGWVNKYEIVFILEIIGDIIMKINQAYLTIQNTFKMTWDYYFLNRKPRRYNITQP